MLRKIFYKQPGKKEEVAVTPLWSSPLDFDEVWKVRIARMASHIRRPSSVADFGCGMMWLETCLPPGSIYLPVDYVRRDERTIVVDLNRDPFPAVTGDVAFMSGVLEYVADVEGFAGNLEKAGFKKIILSYCTLEKRSDMNGRTSLNWVSHKSLFDLLPIFLGGYNLSAIDDVNDNTILVFDRKNEDLPV